MGNKENGILIVSCIYREIGEIHHNDLDIDFNDIKIYIEGLKTKVEHITKENMDYTGMYWIVTLKNEKDIKKIIKDENHKVRGFPIRIEENNRRNKCKYGDHVCKYCKKYIKEEKKCKKCKQLGHRTEDCRSMIF